MSNRFFAKILLAALVLAGLSFATPASAATVPPWEPDPNSLGSLSFYDATGKVVTGGSDLTHLFDYAAASTATQRDTTKATLYFAFPDHAQADTSTWYAPARAAGAVFPNTKYPAPLNTFGNRPVSKAGPSEANLSALLGTAVLDSTAGYKDLVQVRVYDTGPGVPQDTSFWSTDIVFDQTAKTWTQVYPQPAAATSTTTTVAPSPASPSTAGSNVTFTATVSPTAAAGSVQFKDGVNNLGSPVAVSGGTASYSTASLSTASHSITAVFAPTDTTAYAASTSAAITYVVNAKAATDTTTSLGVAPTGPADFGTTETLTATVAPGAAEGSVQFKDGTANVGDSVAVSNGSATTTTTLAPGSHGLTAVFTPTDSSAYNGSTSPVFTYVVNAKPVTQTSTTLTVSPDSPAPAGTQEVLTATVSDAAATGTITFKDGDTVLGTPKTVVDGAASLNQTLASGSHGLTALFTPADPTVYASSTSTVQTYTVKDPARPTSTTVGATPASPQRANTSVTFTATVTPNTATGTIQFKDGTTALGAPVAVTNGSAQYATATLAKGTHSIIAAFTPDTDVFDASASLPLSYVIAEYPGTPASILATAGNQSATVSWAAPTNDGGTPITGYDLQQSTDGTTWTAAAPGGTRTSTVTSKVVIGLTNGTGYFFRVAAINGIGTGAYRPTTTKATPVADATAVAIGAPKSVRYAASATLSVTVTDSRDRSRVPSVPVSLYRRVAGQRAYSLLRTVTTSSSGTASYRTALTANSMFQWHFGGNAAHKAANSAVASVTVAPVVSIAATPTRLKHGKTAKVYGAATPAPVGERVNLQRLIKGKWVNQASTTIHRQKLPNGRTSNGYVFARKLVKKGSYVFRVITAATSYSLAGISGSVTVRAT